MCNSLWCFEMEYEKIQFSRLCLPIRDSQIGRETISYMIIGGDTVLSILILSVTDIFPSQSDDVFYLMAPSVVFWITEHLCRKSGCLPAFLLGTGRAPLVLVGHHHESCYWLAISSLSTLQHVHLSVAAFHRHPHYLVSYLYLVHELSLAPETLLLESLWMPFLASFLSCHKGAYSSFFPLTWFSLNIPISAFLNQMQLFCSSLLGTPE